MSTFFFITFLFFNFEVTNNKNLRHFNPLYNPVIFQYFRTFASRHLLNSPGREGAAEPECALSATISDIIQARRQLKKPPFAYAITLFLSNIFNWLGGVYFKYLSINQFKGVSFKGGFAEVELGEKFSKLKVALLIWGRKGRKA